MLAFDNDGVCDWAFDLAKVADLSLVESALQQVEAVDSTSYIEQSDASNALAACDVIARLRGRPGYTNAYTGAPGPAQHQVS